jgi:UDP-3-O-[3-hydroxymyristoyl] glucosamine N-acyltransferase
MSGMSPFENSDWLRSTAAFRKLGEMAGRLRKLEKKVFGDDA